MTDPFRGVIVAESLEEPAVLKLVTIVSTRVVPVTSEHNTPWVEQWTLHTVEIPENRAARVAREFSKALDTNHAWYADFKNSLFHYIIFSNKVFTIDRADPNQYGEAIAYGLELNIPEYQLDFRPVVLES